MIEMLCSDGIHAGLARRIDEVAVQALLDEVALYPKAGLVSFVDSGSHADMDAATFLASAEALRGYFGEMAQAAADGADFAFLNRIGRGAEARMFSATRGVNTHRGAVFSLGLLTAAAGIGGPDCPADAICSIVAQRFGSAILAARPAADTSHGAQVRACYNAPGAREEAAAGFPTITLHALPAWRQAYCATGSRDRAALHAFYASIAVLEDNNLLYRAGPAGLLEAQSMAYDFIAAGGMIAADGYERACAIHRHFVAKRLSPGGSADLLALTLFLTRFEQMREDA